MFYDLLFRLNFKCLSSYKDPTRNVCCFKFDLTFYILSLFVKIIKIWTSKLDIFDQYFCLIKSELDCAFLSWSFKFLTQTGIHTGWKSRRECVGCFSITLWVDDAWCCAKCQRGPLFWFISLVLTSVLTILRGTYFIHPARVCI